MKKQLMILSILLVSMTVGCNTTNESSEILQSPTEVSSEIHQPPTDLVNEIMTEVETSEMVNSFARPAPSPFWQTASFDYLNFEEAVLEAATHIVVARYAGSRPFGDEHTEFEFIVLDEILGETTERIFIFAQHMHAYVFGYTHEVEYRPGDLSFETGVDYLLPLINTDSVDSIVKRDGDRFVFVRQIVIDLDDPSNSMMYSEYLDDHIEGIDLDETTLAEEIISFVEELAEEIEAEDRFEHIIIDSNDINEILANSPYVFIVEIGEAMRLSHEQEVTIWRLNDIYFATIVESLKGGVNGLSEVVITFPPDAVFPGEQHIVAVQPIEEGRNDRYLPTSRYGLFSMDQLEEIREILANSE